MLINMMPVSAENSPKGRTGDSFEYKKVKHIKVPKIYWNFTRKAVLTMEWIDGIKLTDEAGMEKACLNRKELIDQVLNRIHALAVHDDLFS